MAETTLEFKFFYENNAGFKLRKQENDGGYETIIEVDENAHIADIWPHIKSICTKTFEIEVDAIGVVMKS